MKRFLSVLCAAAAHAAAAHAGDASAETPGTGGIADVVVIDRDTGAPLETHLHRGDYWIAGRPGGRYAVEIHNRLPERLLAVTSVDGVNVVSGETAGWNQTGYVFEANETYRITGWRKSDSQVAAFTFAAAPDSYAARTGRPGNVGVIGVALFRERRPVTIAPEASPPPAALTAPSRDASQSAMQSRSRGGFALGAPAAASPPAPPTASAMAPQGLKLGTAHGEREYSYVGHTAFERLQPQPDQVIRIRYDSLENLVAMGIIRVPDPFPGSGPRYVPDPPG